MFDHDPREQDIRDRENGVRDREEDWLVIGRGASASSVRGDESDRAARDRDSRDRDDPRPSFDPRHVFSRNLDLPHGLDRDFVRDRDRDYTLNGTETRTLATVGAFRVVAERDLRDRNRDGFDIRHLEDQGLVQRVPMKEQDRAVALTDQGQSFLERHRDANSEHRQTFYAGADKARERTHDVQIYPAYLKSAERLQAREARVLRVQLDRELKRDYQRFLQERNRGDRNSDGRPDRSVEEIQDWAREHALPYFDDQVHFPDVRIEYEDANGDVRWEDIEVTTEHYRGAHGSAASRSGFSIYSSGRSGGGAPFDPRAAEEFL